MKSISCVRVFRPRRLIRFFSLLAALGSVASCDFSRVQISCNEHLLSSGLEHFQDRQRGVIHDAKQICTGFVARWANAIHREGCVGEPLLLSMLEAENYIAEIAEKAGALWRLPNYAEFSSITRKDCLNPALNPHAFPNILIENFWAKGVDANEGKSCVVYTLNGARSCRLINQDAIRPFLMVKDAS